MSAPLGTISAGGIHSALCEPFLVEYHAGKGRRDDRVRSVAEPIPTATTENRFGLCQPFVMQVAHAGSDQTRVRSVDDPLPTIPAGHRGELRAALAVCVSDFLDHGGTLGNGGHACALLETGVTLLGLDQDPLEIVRTEAKLREKAAPDALIVKRMNFAGLRRAIDECGWHEGADLILADLGCSSMQFDNPSRGFSFKHEGPLDMRMNPQRGLSARDLLQKLTALHTLFFGKP
jgi:hypothetical protein